MHGVHDTSPGASAKDPTGHGVHDVRPGASAKDPAGHSVHGGPPVALIQPAMHSAPGVTVIVVHWTPLGWPVVVIAWKHTWWVPWSVGTGVQLRVAFSGDDPATGPSVAPSGRAVVVRYKDPSLEVAVTGMESGVPTTTVYAGCTATDGKTSALQSA